MDDSWRNSYDDWKLRDPREDWGRDPEEEYGPVVLDERDEDDYEQESI